MGQIHSQENSDAYTVVIFRGSTAKPLRFSFPRKFIRKLLIVGVLLILADLLVISHYVIRTGEVWELSAFRAEAMSAREQTAAFSAAVDDLKKRLSAMKEVNQRLRVMLGIEVPKTGDMTNGRGGEEVPLPEGSAVPGLDGRPPKPDLVRRRVPPADRRDVGRQRVMVLAAAVLVAFLVIVGQLWYLQVLEGGRFLDASDKNRIRIRPVAAPRGILYDRHGVPLVDNRPAFTLSLIPRELPRDEQDRDAVLGRVAALLQIPFQELSEAVARVPADSFLPVRVRRGLSLEDMARIEEWKLELPGVIVEVEPQRTYPSSRFAAHLLGYVREASDEQLRQGRYRRGDMVGQSGLERLLDEYLRGRDGGQRIEVDALGRPVRLIQHTEPNPGAQVVTTVDRRIQEAAEQAMEGRPGAVVVMDPRNGDVLAMVSTPAFDIDQFTGTIDRAAWQRIVQDPDHPLLNRVIQSQYAPGSIFKVVVAAAGLQEGTLTPGDRVHCDGEFRLGLHALDEHRPEISCPPSIGREAEELHLRKVGVHALEQTPRACLVCLRVDDDADNLSRRQLPDDLPEHPGNGAELSGPIAFVVGPADPRRFMRLPFSRHPETESSGGFCYHCSSSSKRRSMP